MGFKDSFPGRDGETGIVSKELEVYDYALKLV